jgi:hypothetical protein
MDSGCSRHITGQKALLKDFTKKRDGHIRFGNNHKGEVVGHGKVGNSTNSISNVSLVTNLKHNLLSVSQICDLGHSVKFTDKDFSVINKDN